jgi:uncharacterized protein DUF5808
LIKASGGSGTGRATVGESTDFAHGTGAYRGDMRKTGTFLGIPYDWRRPTRARIKQRWWNPRDSRLFTPKSFGWGFDVNLARLFRRR